MKSRIRVTAPRMGLFLLLIVFVAGCAPRVTQPLTVEPGLEWRLVERVQAQEDAFRSVRGFARVWISAEGRSVSGNQVLFAQEPDLFRVEILSPFGQPVLLAAADGSELTVLSPGEGRFFTGEASYRNLQRITRLPLQLSDLVSLLLYRVPLLPVEEPSVAAVREGYRLTLLFGDLRQELLFNRRLQLIGSSWHRGEALLLSASYSSFAATDPPFPQTLTLEVPPQDVRATLTFTELDVNPDIAPERFRIVPPAGYSVEGLP